MLLTRIAVARVLSVCPAGMSEDHVSLWSHGCFLVISLRSASAGMPKLFASCSVFVQAELSSVPKNSMTKERRGELNLRFQLPY